MSFSKLQVIEIKVIISLYYGNLYLFRYSELDRAKRLIRQLFPHNWNVMHYLCVDTKFATEILSAMRKVEFDSFHEYIFRRHELACKFINQYIRVSKYSVVIHDCNIINWVEKYYFNIGVESLIEYASDGKCLGFYHLVADFEFIISQRARFNIQTCAINNNCSMILCRWTREDEPLLTLLFKKDAHKCLWSLLYRINDGQYEYNVNDFWKYIDKYKAKKCRNTMYEFMAEKIKH